MSTKKSRSYTTATLGNVLRHLKPPLSGSPVYSAQIEQFWDAQEKILEETEAYAQH